MGYKDDEYYLSDIIEGDNIKAYVYSPILTDEEKERRYEEIKQASVRPVLSKKKVKPNQGENEKV